MQDCVDKNLKSFTKIDIKNFFWGVEKFNMPWLVINEIENNNYDFLDPELTYYTMSQDCDLLKAKFEMINNLAKFSSSEITSIDTQIMFGDSLTLFPNKTLTLRDINESYDRDGPYNWDSRFSTDGTWEYTDKREIILKFLSFKVNDNG